MFAKVESLHLPHFLFLFAIPYEYIYQQGPDDDKVQSG